jgi:hypothetical protein
MASKKTQTSGDNSTNLQAENITVNTGLSYTETKNIFCELLQLNLPKIQEIAAQEVETRINAMLEQWKVSFEKNKDNIDPLRFTDPLIQYEMHAIAIDVARRGEKSNIELLCELLSMVLTKDCPDLIELISIEARRVLPMLNKKHIASLSLEILANEATINSSPTNLNSILGEILNHISEANNITQGDLQYIACTHVVESRSMSLLNVVPNLVKSVDELKDKSPKEINLFCDKNKLFNIKQLLIITEKCKVGKFNLMAAGKLIGWLNLLNLSAFSGIDIKTLFK